jgi:hypothetical protein
MGFMTPPVILGPVMRAILPTWTPHLGLKRGITAIQLARLFRRYLKKYYFITAFYLHIVVKRVKMGAPLNL